MLHCDRRHPHPEGRPRALKQRFKRNHRSTFRPGLDRLAVRLAKRHKRATARGAPAVLYKSRSVTIDADPNSQITTKIVNAPATPIEPKRTVDTPLTKSYRRGTPWI